MRQQKWHTIALLMPFCCAIAASAGEAPKDNFDSASYDEVLRDLVLNLSKDQTTAQDAAQKLARLGKRSIPVLTEIFQKSFVVQDPEKPSVRKGDIQLAYYSAWSLARIKSAEAVRPLLALLSDEKAPADLRGLAIEAQGIELLEEGGAALQKLAQSEANVSLRKKALSQLSIMPHLWAKCEKLFVDSLSDPDEEVRMVAAKQCMFARIYFSSIEKLIDLIEKDTSIPVRTNAMLALQRMSPLQKVRCGRVVPLLVRICDGNEGPAIIQQQSLRTLNIITGFSFKDNAAVQTWWKKSGEAEYSRLQAALQEPSKENPPAEKPKDEERKSAP